MNLESLHYLTYGLYIVSSLKEDKINGQIANTVMQVCSQPLVITAVINRSNLTHEYISSSKVFTVSILAIDTPLKFIGSFGFKSGRDSNKFADVKHRIGVNGAPVVLDYTVAYLEARLVNQIDVYTHTVFIGEVVNAEIIRDGEPLTYAYYQNVKRGTTPRSAPGYIVEKGGGNQNG